MYRCFLFCFFVVNTLVVSAQLLYPVVGCYQGKSAQGMAIWQDEAFLFNDGGHCRVLDLKSGEITREFDLASAGKNTHVNAACFYEMTNGCGKKEVLLYVTEYNSPSRCFVECVKDSANTLVQTIQLMEKGKNKFVQTWLVDGEKQKLYAIARMTAPKGEKNTAKVRISCYRLPTIEEGQIVVLTEQDMSESFVVEFASGTQGGFIRGKMLYLASGLQESAHGRFNAERAIQVIDLKKKELIKRIDLTYVTTNEPEDIDFYHGKCLLYCGQEGGIYEVKL